MFLDANLVDELSILIVSIADGSVGTPTFFDRPKKSAPGARLVALGDEKVKGRLLLAEVQGAEVIVRSVMAVVARSLFP